jgi:hypothetical protein
MVAAAQHPDPIAALAENDRELLALFIDLGFDPFAFAKQCDCRLLDAVAWLRAPNIAAAIEAVRDTLDSTTALVAARARLTALRSLEKLAADPTSPTDQRRAASTIIRATTPRAIGLTGSVGRPVPDPSGARAIDGPAAAGAIPATAGNRATGGLSGAAAPASSAHSNEPITSAPELSTAHRATDFACSVAKSVPATSAPLSGHAIPLSGPAQTLISAVGGASSG